MVNQPTNYRPDIDGLRALAIAGVLLFHIKPSLLSGGYVGVDMFFVISGYLITSIIYKGISMEKFSLVNFYERRIRRIFPAFFTMLFFVVSSGLLLLPDDFSALSRSAFYAIASISNILFYDVGADYYNTDFENNPLIHTWSLGVEEQFYLALPLLLFASCKLFKSTRSLIVFLLILFAISLASSIYYVHVKPMKAFFLMPFRAWELLLGSTLALAKPRQLSTFLGNSTGTLGLGLVLFSMFLYTEDTAFPGFAALLPCVGGALLIFAGQNPRIWTSRLLSLKPVVALGLISYSVYLWHWPLIAFAKYLFPQSIGITVTVLVASILIGAFSWRFIEQPFRKPDFLQRKTIFGLWAGISVLMLVIAYTIQIHDGFPGRFKGEVVSILAYKKIPQLKAAQAVGGGKKGVFRDTDFDFLATPQYGDLSAEPSVVLWGDSFAVALRPLIETLAKQKGIGFRSFGLPGVAPIEGIVPRAREPYRKEVLAYSEGIVDHIRSNPALKTVILFANWRLYTSTSKPTNSWTFLNTSKTESLEIHEQEQRFSSQLKSTVTRLMNSGKQVIIVYPVPRPACNVPDYLARFSVSGRPLPETVKSGDYFIEEQVVLNALDAIPHHDRVLRVYPHTLLLQNDEVRIMHAGNPLYYDARHLSPPGAWYLKDIFEPIFEIMSLHPESKY